MSVTLFVVYCMALNPYICRSYQIVPADHQLQTISECMIGGMVGSAEFRFEDADWFIKGAYCRENPDEVQVWLRDHR
jgi:hypothetical protein